MKTILITGGCGYIGSHVCVELIQEGYEVIVIDNLCNSSIEVLKRISNITGSDISFYQNDVRDKSALLKIFKKHSIDSVMHFAGSKSLPESLEHPIKYYNNNVVGAITLCKAMAESNCKSIVFSSSAAVYGNPTRLPITENSPLSTSNPYGQSKLIIERLLQDIFISDGQWNIAILRYFNPVGAHESGLIGESPKGVPSNIFPCMCQVAIGKRLKLTIYGGDYDTSDGTGIRDYIHVVDLANGHVKALKSFKHEPQIFSINLGTGRGYSVLEIIKEFEIVSERTIPYEIVSRREGDIAVSYADPSLAAKKLNWKAEYKLKKMCQDAWRWQSMSPNGYN